ncbi:MAG: TRAP transporter substrate-binding protein DctP [Alphaproteobacteria bacterium]
MRLSFSKSGRTPSWSWLCSLGTLLFAFSLVSPALAQTTISVVHPVDRTGIVDEAFGALARDLTEAGDAPVGLQPVITPADDARQGVQLVYAGEAALALLPVGEAIELSDKFAVFEMPFLFDNLDAVGRFVDGEQGRVVLDSLREYGLIGLGLLHQDLRDLAGADLSADPASVDGLRLGVDERTDIRPFDEAGAVSQRSSSAETTKALAEGRIDAAEVTTPAISADGTPQRLERLIVTDHRYEGWLLVANRDWFETLPEESRAAFRETVRNTLDRLNAEANERIEVALAALREAGVDVVELDFAAKRQWQEAMADSLAQYEELIGAEIVTAARRANISSQGGTEAPPLVTGPVVIDGGEVPTRRTYSVLPWNLGDQPDYTPVQLFFGTDRRNSGTQAAPAFDGARSGELKLGSVIVTVPRTHELGQIERPSSFRVVRLIFGGENPKDHIIMQTPVLQTEADFATDLGAIVNKANGKKQAFVFVHGFNVTFEEAAWRTAQMAYDLAFDGAPMFYSWPSRGDIEDYFYDLDSARQARDTLQDFLELVRAESGADIVHLIGHSMGSNPLMEAVAEMWEDRANDALIFNQVILAAADIDRDVFFDLARQVEGAASAFTLYASGKDRASKASEKIRMGGVPRIGYVPADEPTVHSLIDSIDATALDTDFSSLGHSGYAEHAELMGDIGMLFTEGLRPPNWRTPHMKPMSNQNGGGYWMYE